MAVYQTKEAEKVGIQLAQIISSSVIPEILQSDNGPEFVGDCIKLIEIFYDYIHIVPKVNRLSFTVSFLDFFVTVL